MNNNFQLFLSIFLIVFSASFAHSQTWFQEGDYWLYHYGDGLSGTQGYTEVRVQGDTIIDNISVKKLSIFSEGYSFSTDEFYEHSYMRYAYSENQKAYVSNHQGEFGEFADFNISVDSLYNFNQELINGCPAINLELDSLNTFTLDNNALDIQFFSYYDETWDYTFYPIMYERIGSLEGRILAFSVSCYFDGDNYRLCQFKTETDSISFLDQDCFDFPVSIKEDLLDQTISLSPNPVESILTINSELTAKQVQVVNINGKVLLQKENTNEINVEQLTAGVYFMKISVSNQSVTKKFVKM